MVTVALQGILSFIFNAHWRRGWDSNPRYHHWHNGFRDRPNRPLWHLSSGVARWGWPLFEQPVEGGAYRRGGAGLPSPMSGCGVIIPSQGLHAARSVPILAVGLPRAAGRDTGLNA